eukprot:Opistho-2@66363
MSETANSGEATPDAPEDFESGNASNDEIDALEETDGIGSFPVHRPSRADMRQLFSRKMSFSPQEIRVLLVDADGPQRKTCAQYLRRAGYEGESVRETFSTKKCLRPGPIDSNIAHRRLQSSLRWLERVCVCV